MLRSQSGHAPPQLLRARRSTSSVTFRRRRPSVSALSSELHAASRRSSASTPSSAALTATTSPRPMQSGTSSTPAPSGQRRTGRARLMRERRRARPCSAHSAATRRATLSQRLSRWTFGVAPLHPAQPRCSSTPARRGCALTTAPCCTPCVNCRWYGSPYLPISPPYLVHISSYLPMSPPYLPRISPISRPYLAVSRRISPAGWTNQVGRARRPTNQASRVRAAALPAGSALGERRGHGADGHYSA